MAALIAAILCGAGLAGLSWNRGTLFDYPQALVAASMLQDCPAQSSVGRGATSC